jgi:hypothetical protein
MADGPMNRRDALKLGAALGVTLGAAGANRAHAQSAFGAYHFEVEIPGARNASRMIQAVEIAPVEIDARLYGPGAVHWGQAKFTSACTLGASKELQLWWQEAAKGKDIRKNITVTLFKSDKSAGRSYLLQDCFPTQWTSVNFDTSSTVQTETLTVKVGRIEFKV